MSRFGVVASLVKQFDRVHATKTEPFVRRFAAAPKQSPPTKGTGTCVDLGGPKPVMRNLHMNKSLNNIYVAGGIVFAWVTGFYFFRNRRRQNQWRKFYENYDADAAFERMLKGGIFQSCEAEEEDPKKKKKK